MAVLGSSLESGFRQAGLDERESVLNARNRSVLAHGFERVSEKVCGDMWQVALDLAGVREEELLEFPRL